MDSIYIFFCSSSECADTEQILERQVLRARFMGSIFTSSQMQESNPGWLGEKRERYLFEIPSPQRDNIQMGQILDTVLKRDTI